MPYFVVFVMLSLLPYVLSAQVEYIGHRGAPYQAPENTIASVRLAWELGADAVEIAIALTSDQRIMLLHDKTTKRTTGQELSIATSTSDELRKLDAGSFRGAKYAGEKIPFLEEVIETVPPGKKLVIQIRCGSEILPHLEKIIGKSKIKEQCIFIASGWETIRDTKKIFPENKCYWLSSEKEGLAKKLKECAANGLDGVDLSYKLIDLSVVQLTRELKLDMIARTADNPKEAKRLIGLGVSSITTNRPGWLKANLPH